MLNKFAAKELEKLAKASGGLLKPEKVVTRAKDPNSALHDFFEWDAKEAQQKLHHIVARHLIRAYEVYVEIKDGDDAVKVRAFVSLPSDRKKAGGYRLLTTVMKDEEKRAEMLAHALTELESFQRKYQQLTQLEPVFTAIQKVSASHGRKTSEMRATA